MRNKFICGIMAATPCATFVFERICCVPPPASPVDRLPIRWPWMRAKVIRKWRQTFPQSATRQSSHRRSQSRVQCVTRLDSRRRLHPVYAPIRSGQRHQLDDLWSPSTPTPNHERSPSPAETILYENDSYPVCHPFDTTACRVGPKPSTFDSATCKLLMDLRQHATLKLWHHQHQTSQSVQNGRSCSSSLRAFGMSGNLLANQYNGRLNF